MKRIILQPDGLICDSERLEEIRQDVVHGLKKDGVATVPRGIKVIVVDGEEGDE